MGRARSRCVPRPTGGPDRLPQGGIRGMRPGTDQAPRASRRPRPGDGAGAGCAPRRRMAACGPQRAWPLEVSAAAGHAPATPSRAAQCPWMRVQRRGNTPGVSPRGQVRCSGPPERRRQRRAWRRRRGSAPGLGESRAWSTGLISAPRSSGTSPIVSRVSDAARAGVPRGGQATTTGGHRQSKVKPAV